MFEIEGEKPPETVNKLMLMKAINRLRYQYTFIKIKLLYAHIYNADRLINYTYHQF